MVDALISRPWLFALLFSISIVLFVDTYPSSAALLKDIRIGEYDHFTRIVFESDAELVTEQIISSPPGQLTIVFSETEPAFVRKIPIDRGHFLQDLQIRSQQSRLSVTLNFSRQYERLDTFGLDAPPRMALDVFWKAPSSHSENRDTQPQPDAIATSGGQFKGEPTPTSGSNTPIHLPETNDQVSHALTGDEIQRPLREENIDPVENQDILSRIQKETSHKSGGRAPTIQQQMPPSDSISNDSAGETNPSGSGWLQYYLVIALVITTIGILFLLVFMLVSNRLSGDKRKTPKINGYLQHQDKRIASINARVQEQLKRYDEV